MHQVIFLYIILQRKYVNRIIKNHERDREGAGGTREREGWSKRVCAREGEREIEGWIDTERHGKSHEAVFLLDPRTFLSFSFQLERADD